MQIGWGYAISNIPTLPREVTTVAKNAKDVISAFCSVLADLSLSGYGMRPKVAKQFPNIGMPQVRAQGGAPVDDSVIAPPGEDQSVVVPSEVTA